MSIEEPENPELIDVLRVFTEGALDSVRTTLPGKITAYDSTRGRATILPLVQHAHVGEDGERVVKSLPEVHEVPIMFYGPARGRISVPVAVGDLCIMWCCSSSLDQLLQRGDVSKPVDPKDDRRHDLNDAIAMVGFSTSTDCPTDYVLIDGPNKLGGKLLTQKTLMADSFLTAMDTLIAAIASAIAGLPSGVGTAAAAAITTALTAFQLPVTRTAYKTDKTEVK